MTRAPPEQVSGGGRSFLTDTGYHACITLALPAFPDFPFDAMSFELIDPAALAGDPLDAEEPLLARAAQGDAVAHLWEAPVSLIVPRSYQRYAPLADARAEFARRGCPVWLRDCQVADWCRKGRAFLI